MATLSCAMVGPMDGINLLNKSRVRVACRTSSESRVGLVASRV
jgi:hypothetical protein